MKPNEFIKKHGLVEAKRALLITDNCSIGNDDFVSELEGIVGSHVLVGNFGGLKRAKRILKKSYQSWGTMVSVVWNDKPFQCHIDQLEKAITDVESCL